MAQGTADAQEEYFTKGFETGHFNGWGKSADLNFQNSVNVCL
jgi:hypothetical protein